MLNSIMDIKYFLILFICQMFFQKMFKGHCQLLSALSEWPELGQILVSRIFNCGKCFNKNVSTVGVNCHFDPFVSLEA